MNLSRGQGLTREIRVLKKAFLASLLTSHYLHIYALYTIIQILSKIMIWLRQYIIHRFQRRLYKGRSPHVECDAHV